MKTKTQSSEIRLQHEIATAISQLTFIHANHTKLDALDLPFNFLYDKIDFDDLTRPNLLRVLKAFPGHWIKEPSWSGSGINYTLDAPVSGLTIRCYNGEAPPSCVIEETIEYKEVPAHTERIVTRKVKCPEPPDPESTDNPNS